MRPAKVIVLYVEVLFACSTLIIKCNLLTCYVCSTKIGEISDISKYFENFVFQTLGVLTRVYAAELR